MRCRFQHSLYQEAGDCHPRHAVLIYLKEPQINQEPSAGLPAPTSLGPRLPVLSTLLGQGPSPTAGFEQNPPSPGEGGSSGRDSGGHRGAGSGHGCICSICVPESSTQLYVDS
jgi:hypothetical protein